MGGDARTLTISRIFRAPRPLVFSAWVEAERIARWLGLPGFIVVHQHFDPRPGGGFRSTMIEPDGTEHRLFGSYQEIAPPERLVFTHAWELEDGTTSPETLVTLEFFDHGGDTRLEFRQEGFADRKARDDHAGGWTLCLGRLDSWLLTGENKPQGAV
ncbi:SRPBCC family protein [Radicibacter daui]|uniref:SRPBCC family protein n=1 Tax=Radicibacter daui TaxID=3064829 RepID=UPI004046EF21